MDEWPFFLIRASCQPGPLLQSVGKNRLVQVYRMRNPRGLPCNPNTNDERQSEALTHNFSQFLVTTTTDEEKDNGR